MANKNKVEKGSKWGEMFLGEDLITLYIPPGQNEEEKNKWLAINGQEIILAVGKELLVPKSVAELWHNSHNQTQKAQAMMRNVEEISA